MRAGQDIFQPMKLIPPLYEDLSFVARTTVGEIRGGTEQQMRNVVWALFNRWRSTAGQWSKDDTLATACLRPWQFSGWTPGDPNFSVMHNTGFHDPVYRRAFMIVLDVLDTPLGDPIMGARHYHARSMIAKPKWAFFDSGEPRPVAVDDGAHLFYVDVP